MTFIPAGQAVFNFNTAGIACAGQGMSRPGEKCGSACCFFIRVGLTVSEYQCFPLISNYFLYFVNIVKKFIFCLEYNGRQWFSNIISVDVVDSVQLHVQLLLGLCTYLVDNRYLSFRFTYMFLFNSILLLWICTHCKEISIVCLVYILVSILSLLLPRICT